MSRTDFSRIDNHCDSCVKGLLTVSRIDDRCDSCIKDLLSTDCSRIDDRCDFCKKQKLTVAFLCFTWHGEVQNKVHLCSVGLLFLFPLISLLSFPHHPGMVLNKRKNIVAVSLFLAGCASPAAPTNGGNGATDRFRDSSGSIRASYQIFGYSYFWIEKHIIHNYNINHEMKNNNINNDDFPIPHGELLTAS